MTDSMVVALVGMVSGIAAGIIALLGKKHQLQYDVKLALLGQQQKKCEEDSAKKDAQIAKLESNVRWLAQKDEKDKAELEKKIDTVKQHAEGSSGLRLGDSHSDVGK